MHNIFRVVGFFILGVGTIVGFAIGAKIESFLSGLWIFLSSLFLALFILGFAEIIESLRRIENKVAGPRETEYEDERKTEKNM